MKSWDSFLPIKYFVTIHTHTHNNKKTMVLVEDIEANNHAKCNKISEPKNKLA